MNITPPKLTGMTDAEHARDTRLTHRALLCLLTAVGLLALLVISTLVGIWGDPRLGGTGRTLAVPAAFICLTVGWITNLQREELHRAVRSRSDNR